MKGNSIINSRDKVELNFYHEIEIHVLSIGHLYALKLLENFHKYPIITQFYILCMHICQTYVTF